MNGEGCFEFGSCGVVELWSFGVLELCCQSTLSVPMV